ncbi:hypothetical protein LWI29_010715 [Acer saccharum]|uniref:Uncharacterized protein n=1 Tax=Acer saccharum TaxID=4024 RepID=A0AA39W0V4_ACESA|nr:hypothetical protein LWI29_010715 [Acer saccharum]
MMFSTLPVWFLITQTAHRGVTLMPTLERLRCFLLYMPTGQFATLWWLCRRVDLLGLQTMTEIVWFNLAGPGGEEGGGQWGAATDGRRMYTNIANSNRVNFTLAPSRQTTTVGAWAAQDAYTGEILWSTANPSNDTATR